MLLKLFIYYLFKQLTEQKKKVDTLSRNEKVILFNA